MAQRVSLLLGLPLALAPVAAEPPAITVSGDWTVTVGAGQVAIDGRQVTIAAPTPLTITPAVAVTVTDEKYDRLPMYNPKAGGWARGAKLRGLVAQECTARFMLDPASVKVKAAAGAAGEVLQNGPDYAMDLEWGTFGRVENGKVTDTSVVYIDYVYGKCRLDSIVATAAGQVVLREGVAHVANPAPPALQAGEVRLANVWVPGRLANLTEASILPVLEAEFPQELVPPPTAEKLLPKTLQKLRSGEPLRILAWGDSVTQAGYLPDLSQRWQDQFVAGLKAKFPNAKIELIHLGWGGRNTGSFLAEPPGSPFNYQEKVLGSKPDLIVSEFVNDSGLTAAQVEERYGKFLAEFQAIGAEWAILTPHYTRPDWMGLKGERDIDDDPRPYTTALREFTAKHQVALGDASRRWGRLWRQGIPYSTLLLNAINHPNGVGMKMFSDSLLALFP